MDPFTVFPDSAITSAGIISDEFLTLGVDRFIPACRYVHQLPYGYNSDRDDPMTLFKEKKGSCTTKHAVIATLAEELNLPIHKTIGIYAMTDEIVTGTRLILEKYALPYVPMIHCFLEHADKRVDLTEGNHNGKNRSIEAFLFTHPVAPNIPAREEYRLYRDALKEVVLKRKELGGVEIKRILKAREEAIVLLKSKVA